MKTTLTFLGLSFFLSASLYAQTILHVDADSTSATPDGTSWTDAFTSLQDALASASSVDQIWVAEGTYYPDEGMGQIDNDRTSTFQLLNGSTTTQTLNLLTSDPTLFFREEFSEAGP